MQTYGLAGSALQRNVRLNERTGYSCTPTRSASLPSWRVLRACATHAAVVVVAALEVSLRLPPDAPVSAVACSALACAVLLARDSYPRATLLATMPGMVLGWSQLATVIALGHVAYRTSAPHRAYAAPALVVLAAVPAWLVTPGFDGGWRERVLGTGTSILLAAGAYAIGRLAVQCRAWRERAGEAAELQEQDRQAHQRSARHEERARLAREMHDVVAHDITLITMQANVLESAPTLEAARESGFVIHQLSSRTLNELRSVISMLRDNSAEQPRRHRLDELAELAETIGVPVHMQPTTPPERVPEDVSTAIYRTVQESLINVRKHAPGATATVRLGSDHDSVWVEIRNSPATAPARKVPSGGYGLAGLAERAMQLDGTFHARSIDDGGFEVTALYPLRR
ncbi:Signal transduction histidine kinase [Haloechinothrix alba]|uniref:histidine kinase n=1 Tax=Haloechinothrix alba TaxID=664784 RepID=A0A238WX56_9PSEU|nr:histidine kinase [Haloechinothrix alba]SNR51080.1 Signal transduction histidine kinase [Haloechinothrix alba]